MRLAHTRRQLVADIGHSRNSTGGGNSIFDHCQRYPGDAHVDPGNYIHVSPIVATKPALNQPPTHTSDTSGKKLTYPGRR